MAEGTPSDAALAPIVERYFELIRALRRGDPVAVLALMELWHPDGTFEFAGAPPVVGTFVGAVAINALYKNRLGGVGMGVRLETARGVPEDASLGVVDTEIRHLRANGDRVAVSWRTVIGTAEGRGFDVAGAHLFVFEGDRIKHLRVTVSPKPDPSQMAELRLDDLSLNDVGRLSLAAWPVV
jgi:ketosteroid isomerase-like protein